MWRSMHRLVLAALIPGLLVGCAADSPTRWKGQAPQRNAGNLPRGPVGLAVVSTNPVISVEVGPGKWACAGEGAGNAVAALPAVNVDHPIGLVILAPIVVGTAIGGGIYGVVKAPKKANQRRIANATVEAIRQAEIPQKLLAAVAVEAEPFLGGDLVRVDAGVVNGVTNRNAFYQERGLANVLEIDHVEVGTEEGDREGHVRIFLNLRTVLRDANSNAAIHEMGWRYMSESRPEGSAAGTAGDIERMARRFAADLAEEMFLKALPEMAGEFYGVAAVAPRPSRMRMPRETLHPTLKWKPFVPAPELGEVKDLTYELKIWREFPGYNARLVEYERSGLTECEHRVAKRLDPNVTYLWSVRGNFSRNGRPAVSSWGYVRHKKDQGADRIPGPIRYELVYRFATKGK